MRTLRHDRVVKLLGVILEDGNYSLVMEYVRRGNMMKVLQKLPIPLSVKGRFILEIIEGMLYLHEQGLVHKDLKPENILVDKDFHIKIADLGVASFKNWSRLTKEETNRLKKIESASQNNAGTLFYMAPEHLNDFNVKPVEKSDIYSFGIVIWAIFANKEPYEHCINEAHIILGVILGSRPNIEEIVKECPTEIIDLMKQCWEQKAEERPTFAEVSRKYMPFYYENLEENIEDDLKKIEEMWCESEELPQRMKSLQIDAVVVETNNGQIDQPNSVHSSQAQINEALFAACPENQPVESCETSFTPPDNLERKLEREYDYHAFGSRMDKSAVTPEKYTPEMRERERRRKVSHDPFAKLSSAPQWNEQYHKAENIGSNTTPCFWPRQAAIPTQGSLDNLYGPHLNSLLTGNMEDLYDPCSTSAFSLSKTPVAESRPNLGSQISVNQQQKNADADTGIKVSASFTKGTFTYYPPAPPITREDSIMYNITNSSGIQIGSHNHMKIEEQNQHISTSLDASEASYKNYESTGIFDSNAVLTEKQLNLVRENLAKQWKHFARRLGFSNSEIDEIDHDYERDGLKEKVYQMVHKWEMREGSKGATVGKVARALFDCQRPDLLTALMQINEE
ncbi:hypothetical protein ASZ78_006135 [Callipepla squamata]|uniref:Receptor-interacting serine/threonine-protein kinase 1 n=1 Tax=Callipepla squamata TaxID=9009 RepID=A0A226MZ62_CALSU|nr:hypothetical protein ASZ78_006135 [Callipepla squamata]